MLQLKKNYTVEVINQSFSEDIAHQFNKTAVVKFYNPIGGLIATEKYAFVEKETVYQWIKEKKDIHLNSCYIKNFSLKEYRRINDISENKYVDLLNFSAIHTFFDCDNFIDFSLARFSDDNLFFMNSRFGDGDKLFTKVVFGHGDINFSNTNWGKGKVDFQMANVGNGNISFQNAKFSTGDISFVNTNFGDGKVNFKQVNFGDGKVIFHYSKFGAGFIAFDKSVFGEGIKDFRKIEFGEGRVDFKRVNFGNGAVYFDESEFISGRLNFKSAQFGAGEVSFKQVDFGNNDVFFDFVNFGKGNISLYDIKGRNISFVSCHLDSYIDLRVNSCEIIDLTDTIARDIIDLKPLNTPVKIEQLKISGMRNLGQIYLDWKDNKVYNLIANQADTNNRGKANQFLILKEGFHNTGKYNDEDDAYVAFKRFELKADLEERISENSTSKYWNYPITYFKKLVFDYMGLYATNPLRVLASMFTVFSVFSIIYTILPVFVSGSISCPNETVSFFSRLGNSFYYSAITFLTVGYGDCLPSGVFKFLAPLEAWMGVFLMSYFTVAFVRKILR